MITCVLILNKKKTGIKILHFCQFPLPLPNAEELPVTWRNSQIRKKWQKTTGWEGNRREEDWHFGEKKKKKNDQSKGWGQSRDTMTAAVPNLTKWDKVLSMGFLQLSVNSTYSTNALKKKNWYKFMALILESNASVFIRSFCAPTDYSATVNQDPNGPSWEGMTTSIPLY